MVQQSFYEAFKAAERMSPEALFVAHSRTRPDTIQLAEIVRQGEMVGQSLIDLGIRPGDVVGVMLPPWSEWLALMVGAAYAGAVFMPIVTFYKGKELQFILRHSRARIVVTPDSYRGVDYKKLVDTCVGPAGRPLHMVVGASVEGTIPFPAMLTPERFTGPHAVAADAFSFLVFTSGTTADPKGVMHSGRTLLSEIEVQANWRGDAETDINLSPWPPGHVAGALQLLRFLVLGTPVVAMDEWNAEEAARLIERYRITGSSGTPYHMAGLLDAAETGGHDLSSLKHYVLGAAPVPASVVQRCVDYGISVVHAYGSSEHPTVTMGKPDDPLAARLDTEGRLMPGSEILIVDDQDQPVTSGDGEILTRGPELFLGYLDAELNAAAFTADGWYRTGDIGFLDDSGFLHITDRKKDIIIRGGENISSREVEDAMRSLPGVTDAAAVAVKDERLGERVKVFIEGRDVTLDEISRHFLGLGIAKQKIPEFIERVDALPRNATGKVLKPLLRAQPRTG
ncbi:MAG: cyclohexanecarboxylate-CoA ligase [Alphaproteobacteria bacterium HGW-Alphaproteobacteria-18]|nr:MAG: cyclohexanecarboxylate-CoA ligase [Alphaproteobacteria bacterium HGW-Alphaproteobacteria-18]